MYVYTARLIKIVDGDTLDLDIDTGFGIHVQQRIRLLGVDCPERGTIAGDDATAYTKAWIEQYGPDLTLRTVKDRKERYGRYLGYVMSDAHVLNDDLITAGHARDYDGGRRNLPGEPPSPTPVP